MDIWHFKSEKVGSGCLDEDRGEKGNCLVIPILMIAKSFNNRTCRVEEDEIMDTN